MNYIGSKKLLLSFIDDTIVKAVGTNDNTYSICDPFSGSGIVSYHYSGKGNKVISNDIQYYGYSLLRGMIVKDNLTYTQLGGIDNVIKFLNKIDGINGFIYKNYSEDSGRIYFTNNNSKKIDAIRSKIEEWRDIISEDEYYYLIRILLRSADKVANTTAVYGSYLKSIKKSASEDIVLNKESYIINKDFIVYNKDVMDMKIEADIVYLDPPYNHRQYGSNYHILETIAKYDAPLIYGKTGLREYPISKFCSKRYAKETLRDLINNIKSKYIFLSYNNEGIVSLEDIKHIFNDKGEYSIKEITYNRYKSDNKRDYLTNKTIEYIHICKVFNK